MRLAASPARQPPPDLRDQLTGHLRRARGLAVDPEDIFLFPSVSNALRAVAVTCGLAGKPVAFEDPGYAKARLALGEAGAVIRPVPVDDDGIKAEDLRGSDRACYVTPAPGWPASRCPRSAPGLPAGPGWSAATRGCRRPWPRARPP
jgi:GntR family transcriptional regulator/MocR family aminotransferase